MTCLGSRGLPLHAKARSYAQICHRRGHFFMNYPCYQRNPWLILLRDYSGQRRCAKIKFHSTNFLIALAMEATPARRVENIIEPITRRFLIRRTFFVLSGNFVKQRYQWKSERPKRCKRIAKQFLPPLFLEIRRLPIDRQTGIHCKSFKQDLSWASCSTEPRRRCRVVKHAVQIVVLLRIKSPGRSIPIFG